MSNIYYTNYIILLNQEITKSRKISNLHENKGSRICVISHQIPDVVCEGNTM